MKLTSTLIILCFSLELMAQKAGTLDSNFGTDGIETNFQGNLAHIALQKDGKFIATGIGSFNTGFLLIRYQQNGNIDSSFGKNGIVITPFPTGDAYSLAVDIESDGRIIIAGEIYVSGYDNIGLAGYKPSGAIDSSFGMNGLVSISLGFHTSAFVENMIIQKDSKILVVGNSYDQEEITPFIARFDFDGDRDKTFGEKGKVFTTFSTPSQFSSIVLQSDNKILVGGTYDYLTASKFMLLRYLPDGSIDSSFGTNGLAKQGFVENSFCQLNSIALQANGGVICGGFVYLPDSIRTVGNIGLMRFASNGSADSTFNNNALQATMFNNEAEVVKILLQKDGKIIGAGNIGFDFDTSKFAVIRCNTDGNIDSSFGINGLTITAIKDLANCTDALLRSDNKILLGGVNSNISSQKSYFAFARYNNDETKKQIIVQKIRHYIQTHNAQATTLGNVSIYPNPAQSILHIQGLSSNAKLTIVDFNGSIALSRELRAVSGIYDLNIVSLHAGNYLLKIEINGEVFTKQFGKE